MRHLPDAATEGYAGAVGSNVQEQLAERVEQAIGPRRGLLDRDPEYRALKKLAERNRKRPPKTPHDALQHVVDVAREMTDGTFGALAVTGAADYVEGFLVSGMDDTALRALKGPPQGHGPLGTMRQDGLPVRLADVTRHERAFGFPPKHPPMKELLGLPIFVGGEVRGALYVTDRKAGKRFRPEDEQILEVLSHHAGLIIESSWY
jgi:GAF domain-containing protein